MYRINADVPVGTPLTVTASEKTFNEHQKHQIVVTSATGTGAIDVKFSGHTETIQLQTGYTGYAIYDMTNIDSITFTATTATIHVTMSGLED